MSIASSAALPVLHPPGWGILDTPWERRELLRFTADDTVVSRTPISLELFARHRERVSRAFGDVTHELMNEVVNAKINGWYQTCRLGADRSRQRLLAIGNCPPWLASIRTDGTVDWARIMGKITDCCNWAGPVSRAGTLAHVSSCGNRVTFITPEGEIVSAHDVGDFPSAFFTNGRGIAYLTLAGKRVAAYRPDEGHVGSLDVPGLKNAQVRDGVLYCVIEDPVAGTLLKAFEEPSFG